MDALRLHLMPHHRGRIPQLGAPVTAEGYRVEVIELDGRRIDTQLVALLAE